MFDQGSRSDAALGGRGARTNTPAEPATGEREHGGRLGEARRRFPDAPAPFLDLSTGINPVAYPLPAFPADAWTRLPEPQALADLQQAAAAAYRVSDPAMVVAAPGTQILIGLLPLLLPDRAVAILGPTYNEHAAAWRHAGAQVAEVERIEALAEAPCAVLCNPNNPDGRRIGPDQLLALAKRTRMLVVDEAFADFDPALSLAPSLPHPSLLLLRSFGKAYGLAGLRLGFALAAPDLASRLRTALGPWPVSGPAAAIGARALRDRDFLAAAAARLQRDASRLDAMLRTAGLDVVGGTALFRLADAGGRAAETFERLGRAGILVRRFAARPAWLRFGLPGDQPAWDRLGHALRT